MNASMAFSTFVNTPKLAVIHTANKLRSIATTMISPIHSEGTVGMVYKNSTLPTACAVNVAPSERSIKRSGRNFAAIGINQ